MTVLALFPKRHRGTERDLPLRYLVEVDQRDVGHALLEHADAGLQERLPLLGGLVLRVLAKVAEFARTLDLLGELRLELAIQRRDLVLELPEQLRFDF